MLFKYQFTIITFTKVYNIILVLQYRTDIYKFTRYPDVIEKIYPVEMFSVLFPLSVLLSLCVQQAASSLTSAEIQRVMEERILRLLPLFNLNSPDTTTAVVFGNHFRYFSVLSP